MFISKNNVLILLVIIIFVLSAFAGYFWAAGYSLAPARKPAGVTGASGLLDYRVTSETVVLKDREYLCGDIEKITEEKAPEELWGLDQNSLEEKFPAREGWSISFTGPGFLTLTQKPAEFCPKHSSYRHLGIHQEMLAVYEGPLGNDGKLLRLEGIPMELLEPELRIKLGQAADLKKLSYPEVEKLREELEFASDEALNAVLENLDEHS